MNEKEVNFNVCKSMKYPSDIHVVSHLDQIGKAIERIGEAAYSRESLEAVLINYDETKDK